jgi:hypothetical protein
MSLITIEATLPNIDSAIKRMGSAKLRYTSEAVKEATGVVQRTWIEYAQGAPVTYSGGTFRINPRTGEYARSIQDGIRFPDDMTGEVFTTSPHGSIIEDGQKPRDMKIKMLMGGKAKIGKNGKRYITVPFRHGTPGATTMPSMPKAVHNEAKKLDYSRRNGELSSKKYTWGGRLKGDVGERKTHVDPHPGAGYTWKATQYSGMVRVGQQGHSQYFTFRRLSENSDPKSWMHPGVKPRPVREAVKENTQDEVLRLIRNGFEMDVYFLGLGGG